MIISISGAKESKTTNIYCLLCPLTGSPKYVGKANNLKQRYYAHLNPARYKNTHKFNWILLLRRQRLKPNLKLLEVVKISDWKVKEKYWIRYFIKRNYKLTNRTCGADGLSFGNDTSFKKGLKVWNDTHTFSNCQCCHKKFKHSPSTNRKYCTKDCQNKCMEVLPNSGNFKKESIPWNKNKKGYKLNRTKKISKEHKNLLRQYAKGNTYRRKKVFQYDLNLNLINTYPSATHAIQQTGFKGIRNCLSGRNKTSGGYKWVYVCL